MEGESEWVINGIITIAGIIILIPLAGGVVDRTDVLLQLIVMLYVIYTLLSGEAINPPRPK
jgi:CDP-diglyceride synthetase